MNTKAFPKDGADVPPTIAETRAQAAQTPQMVREAMLCGPQKVGSVTIQPLNLDILWLLEACGHPLANPAAAKAEVNTLGMAQLIFCFAGTDEALEAAAEASADSGGLTPFDRAAFAFVRREVPLAEVKALGEAIARLVVAGLAAAPEGGGNPPKAAA